LTYLWTCFLSSNHRVFVVLILTLQWFVTYIIILFIIFLFPKLVPDLSYLALSLCQS
jgi:hypothetical protein